MAVYTGSYRNDLNKLFRQVKLSVYLIDTALQNNSRTETSVAFDEQYLPPVLKNHFTNSKAVCTIEQGTRSIRQAKLVLSETLSFYIPCPFIGGSSEFNTLFEQVNSNSNVVLAELFPETINSFYVEYFSR